MTQYDLNLREYWRILKKRKLIVILTALVLGLFSTVSAVLQAPEALYTSTCSIKFEKETTLEGLYARTLSWSGGDDIETQLAIITGYPVLTEVAKNMSLIPESGSINDPSINAVIEGIKGKIVVEREAYTNIIHINVTDRDPARAQRIANELAETYQRLHSEQQGKRTREALRYIDDQLAAVRMKLKNAEEEFNRFGQANQLISIDLQSENLVLRIKEIKDEIRKNKEIKSELSVLLSRIKEFVKDPSSSESDTNFYSTIATVQYQNTNNKLVELLLKRDTLLENYTEQHPEVITARQNIVENARKMVYLLDLQIETIGQKNIEKKKELDDLDYRTNNLMEKKLEYDRLKREVDSFRNMTALLENKNQEALIRQAEKPEEVVIVRRALPSGSRINPPKILATGLLGAIIGIVLGLIVAFIIETFDTSLGAIEDIEETLGAKVLGVLPFTDEKDVLTSIRDSLPKEPDDHELRKYINLVSHFAPKTMIAESFRALRTNIQFTGEEEKVKSISVTSTSPQEGKSMVSVNLAISMAQAGLKTLLVGSDLRKPMLSNRFGLEESPGLTDILLGSYPWKDTVKTVTDIIMGRMSMDEVIMTPGLDNLNIITSGVIPPNPAELIESKRLEEFLEEAEKEYDIIIFDSTPVLSTADAAILGTKVDGVLIVYRVGAVSKGLLKRTSTQLDQVKCNILGVVLNGMKPDISPDFPSYKYYQYYSYYGESEEAAEEESGGFFSFLGRKKGKKDEKSALSGSGQGSELKKKKTGFSSKFLVAGIAVIILALGLLWQNGIIDPAGFFLSETEDRDEGTKTVSTSKTAATGQIKEERAPEAAPAEETVEIVPEADQDAESDTRGPDNEIKEEAGKDIPEYPSGSYPYSVYLGSFKTVERADRAIGIFAEKGLVSFRVKVNFREKGTWYRIYSGCFASPEDAEQYIEDNNLKDAAVKKTEYAALTGIYEDGNNLSDEMDRIREAGYTPYTVKLDDEFHALLLGAFMGSDSADEFINDLQSSGIQSRIIAR